MTALTDHQRAILGRVVAALAPLPGLRGLVLGGSHARGRARADSDLDVGLYYSAAAPFDVDAVRAIAAGLHDGGDPVVAGIGAWGRWVDGGAWLVIDGQRVDLLWRGVERVRAVAAEATAGRYEVDHAQQPPFGYFGPNLLGETAIALPLSDPFGDIAALKRETAIYPDALRAAVVKQSLWGVEFGLMAFAPKFVANGDAYGVAGCLTRFAHALVLTLFALNRAYPLSDKTALAEISEFAIAPRDFNARLQRTLGAIGQEPETLARSTEEITALFSETVALSENLYAPMWRFDV